MDHNVCYEFINLIPENVQYNYEPIEPGWIRILDLLNKPGDNEPLQCRLRHIRLPQSKVRNSDNAYNALSYAWGNDRKLFEMRVLHKDRFRLSTSIEKIPLTESLYNALRDLRDCEHVQPKTFWIDQICIDQSSDEEKTQQVAQMDKVFQYATSVWTYLGPGEETDDRTFDLMVQIYDHFEPLMKTPEFALFSDRDQMFKPETIGKYSRMTTEDYTPNLWFPKDLFKGKISVLFNDLNRILSGDWTRRLWILQENVLNDDLTLLRGHRALNFEGVVTLCKLSWVGLIPLIDAYYRIVTISASRYDRRWQQQSIRQLDRLSLSVLLRSTRFLDCRDPRDKIYAILGIATDAEQLNIYPDYSISAAQAYTNLSVAFTNQILATGTCFFLDHLHSLSRQVPVEKSYSCMPT